MFLFRQTTHHFFELLVCRDAQSLQLPPKVPEKYSQRILKSHCNVHLIRSASHTESTLTNLELLKDGIWICEGDCEEFGGVGASVFGIELSTEAQGAFLTHKDLLCSWSTVPWRKSRVAYHGTSFENYLGICANGFKCTFGMLGTGVYLGSFWKACRFAARDQEYKFREKPSVLRVVWSCEDHQVLHFPRKIMYCFCGDCYKRPEQRSFCGHAMDWTSEAKIFPEKLFRDQVPGEDTRYYAGSLKPCKYPDSQKFVTQNEEWVLNPSCIVRLAECAILNLNTVVREHYDPLQRNIEIL